MYIDNKIDEILYIDSDFSSKELYEFWDFSRILWLRYRYLTNGFDVTKTNTTNAANLPETGEKENRLMALYGMMMSGLAGLFLVKKRKAEKESL